MSLWRDIIQQMTDSSGKGQIQECDQSFNVKNSIQRKFPQTVWDPSCFTRHQAELMIHRQVHQCYLLIMFSTSTPQAALIQIIKKKKRANEWNKRFGQSLFPFLRLLFLGQDSVVNMWEFSFIPHNGKRSKLRGKYTDQEKKINIKLFKIKSQKNLGNTQDPSKRKMAKLHSIIWIKWPKAQGKLFEVDEVIPSHGIHVNIQNISSTVFTTNGEDSCMGVLPVPLILDKYQARKLVPSCQIAGRRTDLSQMRRECIKLCRMSRKSCQF